MGSIPVQEKERNDFVSEVDRAAEAEIVKELKRSYPRHAILEASAKTQQADGGWATAGLGTWKRVDGTPLETASDGYATGLVTLVLRRAGAGHSKEQLDRAMTWLTQHQDASTGHWPASSLNKKRDPASDVGKVMSDAATAYAVLALAGVKD